MHDIPTRATIGLPRWYARFSTDVPEGSGLPAGDHDRVRMGPLTVFRPGEGCEIATFGPRGSSVVLVDGYVFDGDAIATELGVVHSGSTTAALVAAAYRRWGRDVFLKLDGCYLVAVWDAAEETLLIGHDALGRHPVFYAAEAEGLWFTSNVLALPSSGHISSRPNRLSLALALLLYWPEAGQTFFEGVSRVRPGHYLDVSSRRVVTERKYWDPLPEDDEPWLPDEAVHEEFESTLTRAVARCVEIGAQGIMLSGGVDSVTIAAIASDLARTRQAPPLVAVSARTGYALSGEERMQSKVVEALGLPHVVSTTLEWKQGRDDVSLSLEATPDLPSPTQTWWVGTYTRFYRRTAAQDLRVLLTGSGGDNWLGVADTHAADLLRRLQLVQLIRFMKTDVSTAGASLRSSARRLLWTSGLRPHLDSSWARIAPHSKAAYHRRKWQQRLPAWLCPDDRLRADLIHHLMRRRTPPLTDAGRTPRSYYRHSLRSVTNPYLHHELETANHMETWCGLRLLSPYHDVRLISFFNRISPRALMHGGRYKGLLRPVVGRRLPGLGLETQRKDYAAEMQDRRLRALRQGVAEAWPSYRFEVLGRLGIVDPAGAAREIEGWDRKGFDGLARLFAMMSAERWVGVHATG